MAQALLFWFTTMLCQKTWAGIFPTLQSRTTASKKPTWESMFMEHQPQLEVRILCARRTIWIALGKTLSTLLQSTYEGLVAAKSVTIASGTLQDRVFLAHIQGFTFTPQLQTSSFLATR